VVGSTCPICWGQHVWTNSHEIVARAISGDQLVLIAELSSLGVAWPAEYTSEDPDARAYGLLRMLDDAAAVGLDCSEVASEWVISRSLQAPDVNVTFDSHLPRSA
jgi:hypothetical protein